MKKTPKHDDSLDGTGVGSADTTAPFVAAETAPLAVEPTLTPIEEGQSMEKVLGVTSLLTTEVRAGEWVALADGLQFSFTLAEIIAAETPAKCIVNKYALAKQPKN